MWTELYRASFDLAGFFCHQMPERSFFIGGAQFPLCIRCTALLVGAAAGAVYILSRRPLPPIRFCAVMISPMCVELAFRAAGLIEADNGLRAATGAAFGFFALLGGLRWAAAHGANSG